MNNYIINVNFEKKILYTDLQKLVKNDYNSTKINFTFDKEGRILFKMMYPDGNIYVTQIDNNELILTKGILNQDGRYEIEIALYTDDSRLTDYMTASFEVRKELVETDDLIEADDRLPILDTLIVEINGTKLYLDEVKKQVENGEFNGKDGITPTIGENGNWFIGEIDTGLPSRGEKGEKGEAGGVSIEEVKVITGELENLTTEAKGNLVNAINEVASNSGGGSQFIELNLVLDSSTTGSNPLKITESNANSSQLEVISNAINEYIKKPRPFLLNIKNSEGKVYNKHYNVVLNNFTNEPSPTQIRPGFNYLIIEGYNITDYTFSINGKFENDLFVATSASLIYDSSRYIMGTGEYSTITGTKYFAKIPETNQTPTSNTHITNKKYVDDAIASAITNVLEADY